LTLRAPVLIWLGPVLVCLAGPPEPDEDIAAREHYRFMMRANEKGEIPFNALMNAKREIDLKRSSRKQLSGQPQPENAGLTGWEFLGPGNVGGRIRSIVINPNSPNVMYVGA